jgi:hypothetical protein
VQVVAKETGNEALPSSLGAVSSIILVYRVHFLRTQADILHISLYKGTPLSDTADTNA